MLRVWQGSFVRGIECLQLNALVSGGICATVQKPAPSNALHSVWSAQAPNHPDAEHRECNFNNHVSFL